MNFFRALMRNLFAPPYAGLPLAVFLYFALSFALQPEGALSTHQLADPDDYMRLNQTINWLQSAHPFGAGWFDLGQPRLDPGNHAIVHWARLVDLPLALFMLPFIHALGMPNAALIASFVVPPLLFALLLLLMPAAARPLTGKGRANLSCVMLLFVATVLINYMPGRADHHGYEVIIALFGLSCLERMILCPGGWKAAIAAAVAFACGLWIGTEALPWVLLFIAALAPVAGWRGRFTLRNAAVFGIAFPLAVGVVTLLALPAQDYSSRALSWFSGADLIFALLTAAVFIFGWLGGRITEKLWLRFMLIGALGFCASALFIYFVPDALNGPFADYDNFNSTTALENIGEARPVWPELHAHLYNPGSLKHATVVFLWRVFLPLLGSLVIGWNLFRAPRRARLLWAVHGVFLVPALLLMLFWQGRVAWFAQIFCIAPVTWLAWRCWAEIARRQWSERPRYWAEIAAFLLIAPLPVILLPAILFQQKIYPDVLLFPAERVAPACPLLTAADFLNTHYKGAPRIILSGMNEGPELLFRTPHEPIAAPFNVAGNDDVFRFLSARDDDKARAILRRRHVDLILLCRDIAPFYAGLGDAKTRMRAPLYIDKNGHLRIASDRKHPTMIERLIGGNGPAWLKPVAIPGDPDYLLFEAPKS